MVYCLVMLDIFFKVLGIFGRQTKAFKDEFVQQLLKLVTSGFGLVAALAWNELIREIISTYIRPVAGEFSGMISLLVYAVVVTVIAVMVTYSLTKMSKKEDKKN